MRKDRYCGPFIGGTETAHRTKRGGYDVSDNSGGGVGCSMS
jgi:hypothetical protein